MPVRPKEVKIPAISEYVEGIKESPNLIESPETVGDLLHNMSEYRNCYFVWRTYGTSLEKYINDIKRIIDDYNKENSK